MSRRGLALAALLIVATAGNAHAAEVRLPGTEVLTVTAKETGRTYPLMVALPDDYDESRRWPLLLLTDAPYAFPIVRSIVHRLALSGDIARPPIIVGLGYAVGETRIDSRRRDYTPTPHGDVDARPGRPGTPVRYGEAEIYRHHITSEVLPLLKQRYRIDPADIGFAGHSYGGLFGAHVLLTAPETFRHYILISPSLWYGRKILPARERARALTATDLPADVSFLIGARETTEQPDTEPRADSSYDMVGDMLAFAQNLASRGYPGLTVREEILPGENHMTVYPAAITRGLLYFYGPKALP